MKNSNEFGLPLIFVQNIEVQPVDPKDNIGKPKYGIINSGLFGITIVSGIITGIKFTESLPLYEISFGKNTWWTSEITENQEDIVKFFKLASLERIENTHGLKIKYNS